MNKRLYVLLPLLLVVLVVGCTLARSGSMVDDSLRLIAGNDPALQRDGGSHVQLLVDGTVVYDSGAEPTAGATREPTATVPASTPTVTTEPTAEATPTVTTEPTAEPTAETTATPPLVEWHDTSLWHEPQLGHHHGHDPMTAHPDIVAFLLENPAFATIGHPWLSSPIENDFTPHGKHVGFTNLIETDYGCGDTAPNFNCVSSYYYQVHTTSTANEWRVRIHSHKGVFVVCTPDGEQCGIVATGGHADFGQRHSQYKQTVCPFPETPVLSASHHGDQPPYAAINRQRDGARIFWSNLHNPVTFSSYQPVPNRILQAAWNEMPWSIPAEGEGPECLDPAFDTLTGNNGTKFQVFSFRFRLSNIPRPFEGFTDVYGVIAPGCTETGPTCVPLYVGASVPLGDAFLSRSVQNDNPLAPMQNFDNGHEFVMPGHN